MRSDYYCLSKMAYIFYVGFGGGGGGAFCWMSDVRLQKSHFFVRSFLVLVVPANLASENFSKNYANGSNKSLGF